MSLHEETDSPNPVSKWIKRVIAGFLGLGALLAAAWLICYYVADTSMNATRRVQEFLLAKSESKEGKVNMDRYFFRAYRIGEHAWGVGRELKGVQPHLQQTYFVDRHHRVFRPEPKALSEMLKEELQPRRGDEAFIRKFLLMLNGESYTVLETLPDAATATLTLDAGESIKPPEWIGGNTYRFYAHQEIGGSFTVASSITAGTAFFNPPK